MSKGQKHIDSILYIILCYLITSLISIFYIEIENINSNLLNWEFLLHFMIVCNAMSIGTSIYIYASDRLGAVQVSTFIFSVPFIAMFMAYFVLSEPISLNIVLGGMLSILYIYIINRRN